MMVLAGFSAPAMAANDYKLETSHTVGEECGVVEIDFRNQSPWLYRVLVEGQLEDGSWGRIAGGTVTGDGTIAGTSVLILDNSNSGTTDSSMTWRIQFPEDSGDRALRYYVSSGTESDLYANLPVGTPTIISGIGTDCIAPPPSIVTETLPGAQQGVPYEETLVVESEAPYTTSITAGRLPNGLSLSSEGVISGTPSRAGTFTFTVLAENGPAALARAVPSREFTIVVNPYFLETSHAVACGVADVTLRNVSPWMYRVTIEEQLEDGTWAEIPGGEVTGSGSLGETSLLIVDNRVNETVDASATWSVQFPEDSGVRTIRYAVTAGAERDLYVELPVGEWTVVEGIETDCLPPVVPPTDPEDGGSGDTPGEGAGEAQGGETLPVAGEQPAQAKSAETGAALAKTGADSAALLAGAAGLLVLGGLAALGLARRRGAGA